MLRSEEETATLVSEGLLLPMHGLPTSVIKNEPAYSFSSDEIRVHRNFVINKLNAKLESEKCFSGPQNQGMRLEQLIASVKRLENQQAVSGMLDIKADLAIVVGGYNSSNTSHLVELCEERLPTYFINTFPFPIPFPATFIKYIPSAKVGKLIAA